MSRRADGAAVRTLSVREWGGQRRAFVSEGAAVRESGGGDPDSLVVLYLGVVRAGSGR